MNDSLTPKQEGWRMPAEWTRQSAVWTAWPHDPSIWPVDFDAVLDGFANLAAEIAEVQTLELLVENPDVAERARRLVTAVGGNWANVRLRPIPTDDTWLRDSGPTFVTRGSELAAVCWNFNAWGGKFPHGADALVSRRIADELGLRRFEPGICFEGGSIDVNGAGTVLTTEQCLLNENRNVHLTRSEIEQILCDFLNVEQILWLGQGLEGDDTDGHVDDLSRFISEEVIVTTTAADPHDPQAEYLQENRRRLELAKSPRSRPFRVIPLPCPDRKMDGDRRLPASYANFLFINGKLLVPTFDCPSDRIALETLADLLPDRRVVGLDGRAILFGGGGCHCLTQQQPALQ
jgi:agmatine deiminase